MKLSTLLAVILALSSPAVFAESGKIEGGKAKKEAKDLTNTVKKDHKKIGKQAKSEAKDAWGKTKKLFKGL